MAVLELSVFSDFTYYSDWSSKGCCTETKKPRDLKLGTQVYEALAYLEMWECLNIYYSLGEIASDIGARPISVELLYLACYHTAVYAVKL